MFKVICSVFLVLLFSCDIDLKKPSEEDSGGSNRQELQPAQNLSGAQRSIGRDFCRAIETLNNDLDMGSELTWNGVFVTQDCDQDSSNRTEVKNGVLKKTGDDEFKLVFSEGSYNRNLLDAREDPLLHICVPLFEGSRDISNQRVVEEKVYSVNFERVDNGNPMAIITYAEPNGEGVSMIEREDRVRVEHRSGSEQGFPIDWRISPKPERCNNQSFSQFIADL